MCVSKGILFRFSFQDALLHTILGVIAYIQLDLVPLLFISKHLDYSFPSYI